MYEYRVYRDPDLGWIAEYRDASFQWVWLANGPIEHCTRIIAEDSKRH